MHGFSSRATLTNGSNLAANTRSLQIGTDLEFEPGATGRCVLGLTGQYGNMGSTVTPTGSIGTINTSAYGIGFYATWYGNDGTYVDAQSQVNRLSSDITSSTGGTLATGRTSMARAFSVEAGHRVIMGAESALVPQVQLSWGGLNGGSFTDSTGTSVNLGNSISRVARVGVAYEFARKGGSKFYAIGNVIHDFSGASSVTVGATTTSTALANPVLAEIGFGGTWKFGKSEIYGEANLRQALGGTGGTANNTSFGGTLGFRMKF